MIINFWQNILSIHQIPFLEELSCIPNIKINLIVSNVDGTEREKMGWETEISKSINLKCISDINLLDYIDISDVNIFSGFFVYKDLNKAFSLCKNKNKKIFIYSEGKDDIGLKGYLRLFKDFLLWRVNGAPNIKFLAIGDKGVEWFKKVGVSDRQIIKFGYFTKNYFNSNRFESEFNRKVIFVGRLLPSKGIVELVNAFKDERLNEFTLDIYGNGLLEEDINLFINKNKLYNRVKRYDFVANNIMREKIFNYDVLVLPNTGDEGWGAVVNEALQSGLKVICSVKTGSSCLIKSSGAGVILNSINNETLVEALLRVETLKMSRKYIFDWSQNNISPKVAADKFISIINGKDDRFDW
jgi:Glycosyltransferase